MSHATAGITRGIVLEALEEAVLDLKNIIVMGIDGSNVPHFSPKKSLHLFLWSLGTLKFGSIDRKFCLSQTYPSHDIVQMSTNTTLC